MPTIAIKTDKNVQLVKNAYGEFLNGNIQGVLDLCTDDIDWGAYENSTVPYGQTYYGKPGVGEFFATLGGAIDYTQFEPKEFYPSGDKVFVRGYHQAKVKSTGKTFGHDFLMEFTLRDNKIRSFFAWVDSRDQAHAFQPNYERLTMDMHNLFSNGHFDDVLAYAADDVTVDAVALGTVFEGKEGFRSFMGGFKQGFPDMRLKHTNVFCSGTEVAAEFIAEGTHTGVLPTPKGDVPPTGKTISVKVSEHWVWSDRKIKSIHNYADMASLLQQIGLG